MMKLFTLLLALQLLVNIEHINVLCTSTTSAQQTKDTQQFGSTLQLNTTQNQVKQHNATTTTFGKTPNVNSTANRVIQRLVGGHLLHENVEFSYPEPSSTVQTYQNNLRNKNNRIYFRRKSQSTTTLRPYYERVRTNPPKIVYIGGENLDDTLLLDDNKIDNDELDEASAGEGKGAQSPAKIDDSKKTLADQVAEGKYGLIQSEIFEKEPKRPGILSYAKNAEVPKDTSKNYGGLEADDIWLAEDHLLVLKGGGLNEKDRNEPWKPIDNYEAPLRQVKIPDNPKIPPPFPVQLDENGPIQFIGNHKFPFFNPQFPNESVYVGEAAQGGANGFNPANLPPRYGPPQNSTINNGGQYPPPIPPWLLNGNNNETIQNPFLNGPYPPFPPNGSFPAGFPPFPPNGSQFGPGGPFPGGPFPGGPFPPFPLNGSLGDFNFTEPFDEDDPRLYYPPPYTFEYTSNYTNPVPAGPLVPGIILPPPPNFFSRLNKTKQTTPKSTPSVTKLYKQQQRPITKLVTTTVPPQTHYSTTLKQVIPLDKNRYNYVAPVRSKPISTTTLAPPIIETTTITTLNKVTPNVIRFVPKIQSENNVFNTNKGNPIYYEYFDARKPSREYIPTVTNNPIEDITQLKSTSPKTYVNEVVTPVYQKPSRRPSNTYLPVSQYDYSKYYYVTPQPEIKPNGISNNFVPTSNLDPQISFKPLQSFDQEIETIRQTLQFYKNNQPQQQSPPRTPKAKPVYEYSYGPESSTRKPYNSQSVQFDTTPFKPIIQYSEPYDSSNGFKAMPYSSTESPNQYYTSTVGYKTPKFIQITPREPKQPLKIQPVRQQQQQQVQPQLYLPQQYYRSSTDAPASYYTQKAPVYEDNTQKYYNQYGDKLNPGGLDVTESIPTTTTKNPWYTIEKQIVQELPPLREEQPRVPQRGFARLREYPSNGYTYERPSQQYYSYNQEDEFNKQVTNLRQQIRPNQYHQQNQQQQQQYPVSLLNDTYVNYRHPRPTINPDSEFINRQQYPIQQGQNSPIVNQYYPSNRPQSQSPQSQQQQPLNNPPSLQKDQLVNFQYPLPPVNPDAEYILPQNYRKYHTQQNPVIQYRLPGDQAHVYFITPREMKFNKK